MDGYRRMQTRTQTNERLMMMIDELQRQLEEQRREIAELRANGCNGAPRGNDVPPPPPPQPQVNEVPVPTAEPRTVYQEPLLVRWKRVKPADFEGSKDPLVAQGWLKTIEATLRLMGFTDNEKVLCASYCLTMEARIWWDGIEQSRNVEEMTWADFVHEFNTKFFHMNITRKHYDEFENLRQGDMSVTDVVAKFDQLVRLCPGMVSDEGERVRRLIRVLRPEIAAIVDGASPPRSQEQVVLRAQRAEFHLSKLRRNQPQPSQQTNQASHQNRPPFRNNNNNNNNQNWRNNNKRKGNPQNHQGQGSKRHNGGQHNNNNRQFQTCSKCGKSHPGECRMGSNKCFVCGQEGHYVKNCPRMMNVQAPIPQRALPAQLHHMQASLEGPLISQGRLEAPPTNARIYAMTKEQVAAEASNVVTGQITSLSTNAYVLFDTGATHSFVSSSFAKKLEVHLEPMRQGFTTTLPSGEVMISTHCLRTIPLWISDRELYVDLIVIDMYDYDMILGMDFLSKYNASIDCRKRKVLFQPEGEQKFVYLGESRKKPSMFISAMKAKKLLANGCMGYLANIVNKSQEKEKTRIEDVEVVREFSDVFPEDLSSLPPDREIEFDIELTPGTDPISKAPYRMAPAELKELHTQLKELLDKGFIRLSHSP